MRASLLLLGLVCLLGLSIVFAASDPKTSSNTNYADVVPVDVVVTKCLDENNKLLSKAISVENNNLCDKPALFISNGCDDNSALMVFPENGKYPGSSIDIPKQQYVCAVPNADQLAALGGHICISQEPGTCPSFPDGSDTADFAVPRKLRTITKYSPISKGDFVNFPITADGTFIFPTQVAVLQSSVGASDNSIFGTAQFDFWCRRAGPANSRAVVCTDGTNQNYHSTALDYGFSPASRDAYTFMTYGRGEKVGLVGENGRLDDGSMTNAHPEVYGKFLTSVLPNNTLLPQWPQKVLQPVKPVFAFDPYARPTPTFVQIAASVDDFITQGIHRSLLVQHNMAGLSGSSASDAAVKTFRAFYRGDSVGVTTQGVYYGGYNNDPTDLSLPPSKSEVEINGGYTTAPTWTGCFAHGKYLNNDVNGKPVFEKFDLAALALSSAFVDTRYPANSPLASRPSDSGLSFSASYTCNDWTSITAESYGVSGDSGSPYYTAGNPSGTGSDQPWVYTWLSDGASAKACNSPNYNIYCSWYPTNTDGWKNGDETDVDCGGTTVGLDNTGLPTPNCGCKAGYFYDYDHALCIPCIQDTYCDNPAGCLNQCYPCYTAPTSGAALSTGQLISPAVFPNAYANPSSAYPNSLNQQAGSGTVTPQQEGGVNYYNPQLNTNGTNIIQIGTTFNQITGHYDYAATRCYCATGFVVGSKTTTPTAVPLTELPMWKDTFSAAAAAPRDGSNCVPVVRGDPQITGLQGQDFQVHGIPDEIFNMISHPDMQVNARFVYLEDARCDEFTTCFSHPGTYIDQIGMQIGNDRIKITVGKLEEGLRVFVNEQEIQVGVKKQLRSARVFFSQQRKVHIRTPLFSFAFAASDLFMNQEIALLDSKLAKLGATKVTLTAGQARPHSEIPLHGIVGQTWQNLVYPDNMFIEGAVADYRIEESDLFGNTFAYNKFLQ